MLSVNSVSKIFKKRVVFQDVTFTCYPGTISGFIGPNGCGKSVLFKVISGFLRPTSGEILYEDQVIGKNIDFLPELGVLIEKPGFIESYTHIQNLEYLASIKNTIRRPEIEAALSLVGLDPALTLKVKNYSLGMRQRLGIAQAIMEDQKMIILDEPFNGLDKSGQSEIKSLLKKLRDAEKTILLTSHIEGDIDQLADEIYEFNNSTLAKAAHIHS